MGDRDAEHTLTELQEARAEIDKLRAAILKHKQAMSEYRGAFYDEELWLAVSPLPAMDELDLHATTDAAVWASEFNSVAQRLGYSTMDEGWLIGWFANAMFAQEMAIRRAKEVSDE